MTKIIIITGSSQGIGNATAKLLASDGHYVFGLARSYKYSSLANKNEDGFFEITCDVTNPIKLELIIKSIFEKHKRIDVLINCAGNGVFGVIEDISDEDVASQLNIGILGTVYPIKKVLPIMIDQKYGHIINLTAAGGSQYLPALPFYFASKNALDYISHELRREIAKLGVKVSILEAGPVKSSFGKNMKKIPASRPEYSDYLNSSSEWYGNLFKSRAVTSEYSANIIRNVIVSGKRKVNTSFKDRLLSIVNKISGYLISNKITK